MVMKLIILKNTNLGFFVFSGACSHTRAHNYYAESAQNAQEIKRFISTECLSYGDFLEGNCGEDAFHLSMGESLETSRYYDCLY